MWTVKVGEIVHPDARFHPLESSMIMGYARPEIVHTYARLAVRPARDAALLFSGAGVPHGRVWRASPATGAGDCDVNEYDPTGGPHRRPAGPPKPEKCTAQAPRACDLRRNPRHQPERSTLT